MKSREISPAGFSLIELLIVIAISLVLVGGSIAAFLNFSEKRSVTTVVDELKTYFQRAQTKTAAGDLGGCDQLNGYRVETYVSGSTTFISLQAECTTGIASDAQVNTLADGVTVSPNIDAFFQVLNAGVQLPSGAASEDITVSNGQNSYLFTIYREGRVSEGAWQ